MFPAPRFRPGFRYVSEHVEPGAYRRDFFALSRADISADDRLYCFPPPGSVRAAAAKLLHLAATGVLVAFEAEAAAVPELRQREPGPTPRAAAGDTNATTTATAAAAPPAGYPEDPRAWADRADGRVRAGVGPWLALGPHAGWWPLPTGRWAKRRKRDPPSAEELWRDPAAALARARSSSGSGAASGGGGGGGIDGGTNGGEGATEEPGELVAIFFQFPRPE